MKGFIFKTVAGNGIILLLGEINTPIIKEKWYQSFRTRRTSHILRTLEKDI